MPPTSALTAAEIAELAGVSVATVSKVLNGRSDVGAETRRLVEGVINKHGHRRKRRPTPAAPLVEVVLNVLGGAYAMEIIAGVERAVRPHHLGVVVSGMEGAQTLSDEWIERMLARRPSGIITVFCSPTAEQRDRLSAREIPFVVVDPVAEPAGVPSVAATNWSGGLEAGRHLLALGHRRIGVVAGPEGTLASRARLDGYRAALDEAGIAFDPALVRAGQFRIDQGVTAGHDLLAGPDRPTAIFAFSDPLAVGVYKAAAELGLRIPGDLSVVGYDDTAPASWLHPALTTVHQPLAEMAGEAAAMILATARGEAPARTRVVLATELTVRASTARREN
ncbi:LacI family DNA-binding transcriptional regulator [Paractinoplanes rishiriensis]|uniref:LacI family transcriptional regulator n=1 Tax=Paractinoplanes rishiriensis TaxID=1050105 RepID=A0A919K294_9ACTN|nr:LacI family DNA-binding transcriptional regulator [Actinoplanes rishiriensis]GIE97504.1 LacI family transcriptional regulator [Actinoplanes rishiriensis]